MRIGVIRYPGSNCFFDTIRYFGEENCVEIWHTEKELTENIHLLIIPGGFAFGDRYYEKATKSFEYNPGKMAKEAHVTTIIENAYQRNIPILGICNGFQILTKMGLLPGKLVQNEDLLFMSKKV